jgi:homoserine dehydrogenase
MTLNAVVIGPGRVGTAVARQAATLRWRMGYIGSRQVSAGSHSYAWKVDAPFAERLDQLIEFIGFEPDVALVTTPPFGDKGERESEILEGLAGKKLPTVICTKEMLAYRYEQLQKQVIPRTKKFACNASVGGEVGILDILAQRRVRGRPIVFEIAPNASTNFVFSKMKRDGMRGACKAAEDDGYLEPGEGSLLHKLDRECLDGVYKSCAVFNRLGLGQGTFLTPDMVDRSALTQEELNQLPEMLPKRLVVSFSNIASKGSKPAWAGFYAELCGWTVCGGLRSVGIDVPWIPDGPSAAVRILESHDVPFVASGRGAGAEATAGQMIRDVQNLNITGRP